MNDVAWVITAVAAVVVVIPVSVYLCAKLGRYGYLMGQRRFERDNGGRFDGTGTR